MAPVRERAGRATYPRSASVAWIAANLAAVAGGLAHMDFGHDSATSVHNLLDFLFNVPSVSEAARELAQIGMAVSLGGFGKATASPDGGADGRQPGRRCRGGGGGGRP
ncbi:hypothetical protein HYH02_001029 [Chlamydomonas schloesseri]|uniref:Uncharacterized protein n=1 Tax=Chlamydomonas schloesseri TaxID=2026947 RepID=A0A836BCP6_9CHLO|nr:hypothetical protein HYH02_001029 [Chlamydomonas schloesseri]|eukprot:KAG2453984.1 hypothetical protein HYH02_001029 [Chlamydomonas schloesseri]